MVDLLSSEEAVIDKAKSLLEQEKSIPAEVRSHFEELLKAYIKLNKGQSRLIRLSDKSQDKLNIANAKLENFSSKLSTINILSYTVEPPYSGHFGKVVLIIEVSLIQGVC